MRRVRVSPAWLLVPALAFLVVLPPVFRGCSCGHDFDFHLVSWMEAAAQFRAGTIHLHWAFSPAWNAGEPRFVFYPPLSWVLGAVLGLVLPWGAVPLAFTWIAVTAAGAGMYRLSRQLAQEQTSLLAATVYMANPYMIFTAYERTAYGELLAAAWIPLLLEGVMRERVTVLRIAIPVALLWLTNAPAAVMGCYALALLAAIRLVVEWRDGRRPSSQASVAECRRSAIRTAADAIMGVALGIALAAFYIVPAAYERRWVQIAMATIAGMRPGDNFLFRRTGDGPHDAVLHTASAIAVLILAAAVAVFGVAYARVKDGPKRLVQLAGLAAAIGFMLLPVSAVVWRVAPEMAFLQFPWRLLAVLAAVVCAGTAIAIEGLRLRPPVPVTAAVALAAAMALPAAAVFWQSCDEEDTVAAQRAVFTSKTGVDATDEYTPAEADNDTLGHRDPPFWLAADSEAPAPAAGVTGPVPPHFTVEVPTDEDLVLNLRQYPAWQVRIDGLPTEERIARTDGLIAVPVHAGTVRVDVAYAGGWDERAGESISAGAILCCIARAAAGRRRRPGGGSRIIET
jgi:hypothetical protein